jgi:hypothetical protein
MPRAVFEPTIPVTKRTKPTPPVIGTGSIYGIDDMNLTEIVWKHEEWIRLAQNMDQWRLLVTTVMNILVPEKSVIY